ncbi:MAG: hypothetical protein ABI311_03485, partial [Gemmatimonadaceae bacterium]
TAHNSFVLIGAELGVTGLMLFVTMLGTAFYHLAQIKDGPRGDPLVTAEDSAFAQTLTTSLIGFCVAGFFVSAAYFSFLYVLIGLVIAEDSLRKRRLARGAGQTGHVAQEPPGLSGVKRRQQKQLPQAHWAPTA